MDNIWLEAAVWMGLALVAAVVASRIGISVALVEIIVGVIAGNISGLSTSEWVAFLAGLGSITLTFLAGAEIDPDSLRQHFWFSLIVGFVAFLSPFVGALAYAYWGAGWDLQAAQIAGIALSTTSVAVVYAVMVETGLNESPLGKKILAACFVNDLGTVLALGVLFANLNVWMVVFVGVSIVVLASLPTVMPWVLTTFGGRVSEIEVKFLLLVLFFLGGLAKAANSEAVLPAYLIGLMVAGVFFRNRTLNSRMRTTAFAILTPFFFLRAGLLISLPAVVSGAGLILTLLAVKMVTKFIGVRPLTAAFRLPSRDGHYTTLLMSTGLTFGSISALFGLEHGIITQGQYSALVTVVILSAVVPTLIAQRFFLPRVERVAPTGTVSELNTGAITT